MKHFRPQRLVLAMACLWLNLAAPGSQAAVTVSGSTHFDPGGQLPIGPGSLSQPGRTLWVGNGGGNGSFAAGAGSTVDLAALFISASGSTGSVLLDGTGTLLTLGRDDGGSRLEVGNYGHATLTVSGGARLDARATCLSAYCGATVSNSTGSTGLLAITGAGSSASFMGALNVANAGVDNRFDFGRPGLTANGQAHVLAGGLLQAGALSVASVYPSPYGANGQEHAVGQLTVSGASSRLVLDGQGSWDAGLNIGNGLRADGSATVAGGAQVLIAPADAGSAAWVRVGNGGTGRLGIDGPATELRLQAAPGRSFVHVADGGTRSGELRITGGGSLIGMDDLRTASTQGHSAVLEVAGAGSRVVGGSAGAALYLGAESAASGNNQLLVNTGGSVQMGRLVVGLEQPGQNQVVLTGSGSRIALNGTNTERLYVANGSVLVSGGALLDVRADEANCAGGVWCATKIGTIAGGSGALTVQGSGSVGRFTGHFQLGVTDLATPAADGWTRGTPGGRTTAQLRVLDAGLIQTDHVTLGLGTFSTGATGGESAQVDFTVQGAGSHFEVLGGDGLGSYLQTVTWNARNTSVDIGVLDGGVLALKSTNGNGAYLNLSVLAGSTRLRVSGAGSTLALAADAAGFSNILMARSAGSFAELAVSQGGRVSGNQYLGIGMAPGAVGVAAIAGAGSAYVSDASFAQTAVGTNGGQGTLAVSSGGQLQMAAGTAFLSVGTGTRNGVAANGLLRVDGGTAQVLGRYNPQDVAGLGIGWMHVGNDAQGSVQITNGGRLLIDSDGPADPASGWMGSGLVVGKSSTQPGSGQVLVSGAGSRLDTTGTNPFITLGTGTMGSGMLRVAAGGVVATTLMGVGDAGGTGTVALDASTLRLDGAWRSGPTMGASLAVASGGGTGIVSLTHGSQLLIHADGQERGNLAVGGAAFAPGGVGALRVDSGSIVRVTGGGGGQVLLGSTPGGFGTLTLAGGSALVTDYVGVGAYSGQNTGGVATLIVNDTSTVTASTIEIGAKGYVGGTGTLAGNVINRGILSPGNSPGTLHVQGSFANQAGGRLVLEVEADGHGGFVTDQLVFDPGSPVNLAGLQIEFRFLGSTNPNAFQASGGFQIDSFLRQGNAGLDHTLLSSATYSASSTAYQFNSFSFNANGGAVFQAQAVPEPGTSALFAAGLGLGGWMQRRRARRC